jgi:membrane-bound ClpP family serine protease
MAVAVVVFSVGLTLFHVDPFQMMAVIAASGLVLFLWNVYLLKEDKG